MRFPLAFALYLAGCVCFTGNAPWPMTLSLFAAFVLYVFAGAAVLWYIDKRETAQERG